MLARDHRASTRTSRSTRSTGLLVDYCREHDIRRDRQGPARGHRLRLRAADGPDEPAAVRASTRCSCRPARSAASCRARWSRRSRPTAATSRTCCPTSVHRLPARADRGQAALIEPAGRVDTGWQLRRTRGAGADCRAVRARRPVRGCGACTGSSNPSTRWSPSSRRRGGPDDLELRRPPRRRARAARRHPGGAARRAGRRAGRAGPPRRAGRRRRAGGGADPLAARRPTPRPRSPAAQHRSRPAGRRRPRRGRADRSPRARHEAERAVADARRQYTELTDRARKEAEQIGRGGPGHPRPLRRRRPRRAEPAGVPDRGRAGRERRGGPRGRRRRGRDRPAAPASATPTSTPSSPSSRTCSARRSPPSTRGRSQLRAGNGVPDYVGSDYRR